MKKLLLAIKCLLWTLSVLRDTQKRAFLSPGLNVTRKAFCLKLTAVSFVNEFLVTFSRSVGLEKRNLAKVRRLLYFFLMQVHQTRPSAEPSSSETGGISYRPMLTDIKGRVNEQLIANVVAKPQKNLEYCEESWRRKKPRASKRAGRISAARLLKLCSDKLRNV